MTTFTHQDGQYVSVDGARLYVEQRGQVDGPALVFLHGGFDTIETFNALTPRLGRTHRLIGIDSRGQGRSTMGDGPLTYRRIETDVISVLDHLGIDRCRIIGHSDGGIVALRLAASTPALVDKIVAIGAHWTLPQDDPARKKIAAITPSRWREMFPNSVDRYLALNPEPAFEHLTEAVVTMWLANDADGYPGETIQRITCDTLVIRGDEDSLVSRTNTLELVEQVARARLAVLPFTGHAPHEDKADWVLSLIEAFLQAE